MEELLQLFNRSTRPTTKRKCAPKYSWKRKIAAGQNGNNRGNVVEQPNSSHPYGAVTAFPLATKTLAHASTPTDTNSSPVGWCGGVSACDLTGVA